MPGPDWLQFKANTEIQRNDIVHSPKGTVWKKHMYTKIVNGRYIYEEGRKNIDVVGKNAGKKVGERLRIENILYKDIPSEEGTYWKHEDINTIVRKVSDEYVWDSKQGKYVKK